MAVDNLAIAKATAMDIASLHSFQFRPEVMQGIYKTYGNGFMALDFIRSLGREGMVSARSMTAEEQNYPHRTITMGAVSVGGAPGAAATITLDADDLDASNNYYPRVGFTVLLGDIINGFVEAWISSISAVTSTVTLTVYPYDVTKTLSATYIATGKEVAILDSAFAPGTNQPAPTSVGSVQRTFYTQIMKESLGFEGGQLDLGKWIQVEGVGLWREEFARAEFLLDLQMEGALIMGQLNSNASIVQASVMTGSNNTVQKSKGIYTWIDELGGDIGYTNAGSFTVDGELDDAAEYFESVGITNDVVYFPMGGSLYRRLENSAVDYIEGASGGLLENFVRIDGYQGNGAANRGLDIGFKTIHKSGIQFVLHKLPIFSNPKLLGIADYKLNDAGMMIPITEVRDPKSGVILPNVGINYLGLGSHSRKRVVGTLAGMDGFGNQVLGNPIVSQMDGQYTYWLTEAMFTFMEAWKCALVKRTS